jgi:RNA polymerase sigma-70 factor (ECF subfamily)
MTDSARRLEPAELLAHAGWLRALAASLVRDDADDVVQATLLAAIRKPPRDGIPLAPWLARVARHLSLNTRRAASRRSRHELAVPPAPQPASPAESVARAEMFEDVVRAVLDLEPIHRDVVLLRFFDGLAWPETAARLAVPVETARTRLKRALAVLRERLDRRYGDRAAWALLLVPAGAAPPSEVSPAVTSGTVLTAGRVAAASLAVGVAGAGWLALRPQPPAVDGAPAAPVAETASVARGRPRAADVDPAPAGAAPAETSAAAPTRWVLRGRLTGLDADEAVPANVAVYVWNQDMKSSKPPEPLRPTARRDGAFESDVPVTAGTGAKTLGFVVIADHPDYLPARAEVPIPKNASADAAGIAVLACSIGMRRAAILSIRVADERGDAVPGARVAAFAVEDRAPAEWPADGAETDSAGSARLRAERGAKYLVVAVKSGAAPAAVPADGGDARLTIVLPVGATIAGRVTQNGAPAAGARVRLACAASGGRTLDLGESEAYWEEGGVVSPCEVVVDTSADGRYAATGLTEGEWRADVIADGRGRELNGFRRRVEAPADDADFDVATAHVTIDVRSGSEPLGGVRLFGLGPVKVMETGADGRAEADVAPGRRYQINVAHDGYRNAIRQFVAPSAGGSDVVAIALDPLPRGSVAVLVRDADGRPVTSASLALFRDASASPWRPDHSTLRTHSDDGRFVAPAIEPGRWHVVVRAGRNWKPDFSWNGDEGTWLDATAEVEVADGEKEIAVTVRRGGRLRIAARDAKGTILAADCVVRDQSGAAVRCSFATRYGNRGACSMSEGHLGLNAPTDVAEALPSGRYRVTLSHEGFEEKTLEAVVEAGRTCVLDVTMEGGEAPPRPVEVPAEPR